MINIHEKLWFVKTNRGDEEGLAYMTHYKEDKAFSNRKETGLNWANGRTKEKSVGEVIDNTPATGFYIGDSVSRWSTSNKLFRVTDPRGFIVEVPTGNIATLLHLTTVEKGVIKEECVWGREGSNHVLLPKGSEPYEQALADKDTLENKTIKVKDLQEGDVVLTFGSDMEYTYLGKFKNTWEIKNVERSGYSGYGSSRRFIEPTCISTQQVTDSKYVTLFAYCYSHSKDTYYVKESLSKIVKVIRNESFDVTKVRHELPNRMWSKIDRLYGQGIESKVISFNKK